MPETHRDHSKLALRSAALFFAVLCGSACSLADANPFPEKQGRCELRPVDDQCTDWREFQGPSMLAIQGTCETLAAAKKGAGGWTEGKTCDTAGMFGGCQSKSADGTKQTNWYYEGEKIKTIDEAKAKCDDDQTWVSPQ